MAVTMARATIAQKTQLVLESTYGTVPATPHWKRLPTIAVKPRPNVEASRHRIQGEKFTNVVIPNKEWSSATFEGGLTFSELPFIYSSLLSPPLGGTPLVITYPTVGTDGQYSWVMAPQNDAPDTPATFSMQHGDASANGIQVGGVVVTDATIDISRQECKISGSLISLPWVTGQTLAVNDTPAGAVVSLVENVPIMPGYFTGYMDPLFANIGTTKLGKLMSIQWAVTGRWQLEWVIDASQGSYLQLVEVEPTASVTLKLEADSQAAGFTTKYRAGSLAYLRLTTGSAAPLIGGSTHYSMQLDVPFEVKDLQEYSDEGGTYAIGFVLDPIADPTAGFPMQLTSVSKQQEI